MDDLAFPTLSLSLIVVDFCVLCRKEWMVVQTRFCIALKNEPNSRFSTKLVEFSDFHRIGAKEQDEEENTRKKNKEKLHTTTS